LFDTEAIIASFFYFEKSRQIIFKALAEKSWSQIKDILRMEADKLSEIDLEEAHESAKKVALTGEIYVRSDEFSRRFLVKKLAEKGIVTRVSASSEWLYYLDYLLQEGINNPGVGFIQRFKNKVKGFFQRRYEKTIKKIFSRSVITSKKLR
jgi:predicted nucleotide-binding protein (sugar kinase/HSP70/actin superfamily)